ncbi:hypothetical protein QBC32DRAFT_224571 [Pseudoneurospora amorphoporcata]|uniref:Uncharacterized protein n=1 Tax=Pseudoneurospora amorphoporcata TaxID=241081 RepID=A0AAN6NLX0_9PEZI|nr:hypothetical protein QBC32DRAFT_224571 [Pseudoneurospora amorphoporcata]
MSNVGGFGGFLSLSNESQHDGEHTGLHGSGESDDVDMSEFFDFEAYERDMNKIITLATQLAANQPAHAPKTRVGASGNGSGSPSYRVPISPQTLFTSSVHSPLLSPSPSGSDMDMEGEPVAPSPVDDTKSLSGLTVFAAVTDQNVSLHDGDDGAKASNISGSKRKSGSTHCEDQTEPYYDVGMDSPVFSDPLEFQTPHEMGQTQVEATALAPELVGNNPTADTDAHGENRIEDLTASPVTADEDISSSPPSSPSNREKEHYEPPMTRMRARARAQNTPAAQEPEAELKRKDKETKNQLPQYEVYRILASVIIEGLLYYRAAWKGLGAPDPNFYAARGFKICPNRLISFHERYPKQPGPPKRLQEWKEAFDNGEVAEAHEDDDLPVDR